MYDEILESEVKTKTSFLTPYIRNNYIQNSC